MKSAAVVNYAPTNQCCRNPRNRDAVDWRGRCAALVANVGVCGSDLHQWTADHSWPVNYPVAGSRVWRPYYC